MKRKKIRQKPRPRSLGQRNRLRLRITLRHIAPPIWREISVPDGYSLLQLHRAIQLIFGWLDYHLFEFAVGPRRFEAAHSEATGESAAAVTLRELGLAAQSALTYVYDMGDYWEHDIRVVDITSMSDDEEPDELAYLTDGARAAPPEDVGGPPGYEMALASLARRAADLDEGPDPELIAWLDPDFDSELFDRRAGDHALRLASAWRVI
jgi:Plasmid pRiA4b ORF-3-like protein